MIRKESGQILIIVFVALGVVLFSVLFIIAGAQIYFGNAQHAYEAEKAVFLAEAGIDKAVNSLNKNPNYAGETETNLGDGSYSVTLTTKDAASKIIEATGYIPGKTNPKVKRTIKIESSKGVGAAFNYGLQVGQGGITMGNSATLNGSVYSNGNIVGGNNIVINGDTFVAGGTQPVADQASPDCVPPNCQDFIFGKSISGENRKDTAQSFKPTTTAVINKVSLELKKTGFPANPTVRIMKDDGGRPDKTQVLTSGILAANLVTESFSFVDVSFQSSPTLNAGVTYWLMISASSLDNSNYWYWSNDLAQGYIGGEPKWSANWQTGNPVWNSISGDLGFKTWMGGVVTLLSGGNGALANGDVHANTIDGLTINGDAYYSVILNSTVSGNSYPGSTDPTPTVFPISDANIAAWKLEAEQAGVTAGSLAFGNSCTSTLGPGKITGSLSFGNGCTVTVKSPLWIAGAMSVGNTTIFKLDPTFGASSGVIIVDGATSLGNDNDLRGSGTSGSYLMLLSTFSGTAITMGNSSISGIVYAPSGIVVIQNGASFKEIVANGITMGNTATLNYETGLANTFFTSGPGGSFTLVKGTYQVK